MSRDFDISRAPIDPQLLSTLEKHALRAGSALDEAVVELHEQMAQLVDANRQHIDVYDKSIGNVCKTVGTVTQSASALMDECERLGNSLRYIDQLAQQLRELRLAVERLDSIL